MKTISVVTPCYNEEANVEELYRRVRAVMTGLGKYRYEHIFIDNASRDGTVEILKGIAARDTNVRIIVNARNFGHIRSPMHALFQARGDAIIGMVADLQDPPEMIPDFVRKWEEGFSMVLAIKSASQENALMFWVRKRYYALVARLSSIETFENFTGFGLYDRRVLDIIKSFGDPYPYFRGMVGEIGLPHATIPFNQPPRKRGITKNNFYTLYDLAMLGITNLSKVPLRVVTFSGFACAALCIAVAFFYVVYKLMFWDRFSVGTAPLVIGIFFFGSVQLISVGILGEYIGSIHTHVQKRPLVIERERVNFEHEPGLPPPNRYAKRPGLRFMVERGKAEPGHAEVGTAEARTSPRTLILRWILPVAIAGVLLYLALRGVEWVSVWNAIAHARSEFLLAGALITCGSSFLRALRWRILLNAEAHFDVMTVFWATMAGYLGNAFLPARAGELVRSFAISSRSHLTRTYVLTTALAERMMDAIALVLWSSFILLGVHPKPAWLDNASRTAAIFAGAGLVAVIVLPHTGNLCEAVILRLPLPGHLREILLHTAQQVVTGMKVFHDVRRFAGFAVFTVLIWAADAFSIAVSVRALDIQIPYSVAALLVCGLGLSSAVPSTPGYVGIFQFVTASVLMPFGVSKDQAIAYSFVSQAMSYVVVLALGLPGLYRFKGWRNAKPRYLP